MAELVIGRDNTVVMRLEQDGQTVAPGAVTRVKLWIPAGTDGGPVVFDSATDPDIELIDSATRVSITGLERDLKPGSYTGYLTVFDAANTNGLAWARPRVRVLSWRPESSD